jgi:hypothetical protein
MAKVRRTAGRAGSGERQEGERQEEVVEDGDIFFFYRPRVETNDPEALGDVQRFFMVLKPRGGTAFRLAILGRKRLPDASGHERIWGFIDKVTKSGSALEATLKEQHYGTKTRGRRTLPAARPAGEGVYALVQIRRNLHLTYELELPERPGEVQREFNIPPQGGFILSIKNPEKPAPPGTGLPAEEEAHYPKPLQQEFADRRFATADPRLLDYEGAEFVLIGARTDPERAYGLDIEAEHETLRKADLFRQLKMSERDHPLEPLLKGEWR